MICIFLHLLLTLFFVFTLFFGFVSHFPILLHPSSVFPSFIYCKLICVLHNVFINNVFCFKKIVVELNKFRIFPFHFKGFLTFFLFKFNLLKHVNTMLLFILMVEAVKTQTQYLNVFLYLIENTRCNKKFTLINKCQYKAYLNRKKLQWIVIYCSLIGQSLILKFIDKNKLAS